MHCVDLGESFPTILLPTSIFLQNLVSIQLPTSPETSTFDFRITQPFHFPMVFSTPRLRSLPPCAAPLCTAGLQTRTLVCDRCIPNAAMRCSRRRGRARHKPVAVRDPDAQRLPPGPPLPLPGCRLWTLNVESKYFNFHFDFAVGQNTKISASKKYRQNIGKISAKYQNTDVLIIVF